MYETGKVATAFYEGEAPDECKVQENHRNGDCVYFLGKQGHERAARLDDGADVYYFMGDKGAERLYKKRAKGSRSCSYYTGPAGRERLVREEGTYIEHYKGARRREYMVSRQELGEGAVEYFEGKRPGDERLVKRVFPWGKEIHFHGRAGYESVDRVHWPEERLAQIYAGNKGEERLVQTMRADGTRQLFVGPRNEERKVRTKLPTAADGRPGSTVLRWRGKRRQEKLLWRKLFDDRTKTCKEECALKPGSSIWSSDVRRFTPAPGALPMCTVHFSNGAYATYRGTGDDESLVMMCTGDGRTTYYWGEAGEERKGRTEVKGMAGLVTVLGQAIQLPPEAFGIDVRTSDEAMVASTNVIYYDGAQGEERLTRIECCNGGTYWLEGRQGQEWITKVCNSWGLVTCYAGPRGSERVTKREWPSSGRAEWFEGEAGEERLVRAVRRSVRNGSSVPITSFYDGPHNRERKTWEMAPGGMMRYFVGERDAERKVAEVDPDGTARHFQGERGNERMVRHIPGSTEPAQPQVSVTCNAGVKRKLGEAFEFLEGLSADNHCNEHVYNEMSKQLRNVYCACDDKEE